MPSRPVLSSTSIMRCAAAFGVLSLVAAPAFAQEKRAPQYRVLTLTDGRSITAQILSTEATGLLLRTPQGESVVSFEVLLDMQPTDAAAYEAQTDWVVYVAVDATMMDATLSLFQGIDGVSAHRVGSAVNGVSTTAAAASASCKGDIQCVADAVDGAAWMWVVTSGTSADGAPLFRGALNKGSTRTKVVIEDTSRDQMWTGLHLAIGLRAPSTSPPAANGTNTSPNNKTGEFSPGKVTALSFIPLPGASAMAQKDWGNAGLAWGIAVPSAAVFVVGSLLSQEEVNPASPGFLLSAAGGSYLSIVFANQVTGMRAYERGLSVAPMSLKGGAKGAQVTLRR